MDVVGSEIGQKMRSAIKAKLTELGCYVDDELPDYVMVMVANKRTRAQMEDDLQLFLGDNTELFVNWLHQVLKKLQEVTVTPLKAAEPEKSKEKGKEKKSKDKKEKDKTKLKKIESTKKAKKKDKEKQKSRKKVEKKSHKSKKKSKSHEMIRPNIPPLLMNMEKVSEPSITDVFAGQILKNHGITIDMPVEEKIVETKPVIIEPKRPILPIIDPATITTQSEPVEVPSTEEAAPVTTAAPREEQIKEMEEIEAKIQGLKQKLVEQLDSMSDDDDFINIRTEADELMNDFVEDVFQEISSQTPVVKTPPLSSQKSPSPPPAPVITEDLTIQTENLPKEPETLPQIELKLPKRPVRERLGAREEKKIVEVPSVKEKEDKKAESPERFTPEREPDFWGKWKSAKSRLSDPEPPKRTSVSEESDKSDSSSKKVSSKVSSSSDRSSRPRVSCASVVRVRPRPRVAPNSSLLMRAVADAHKSLLNIPPKVDQEPPKIKRALVMPMRRCTDAQNIVIQIPANREGRGSHDNMVVDLDATTKFDKEEYIPSSITKKIINTDYVPSRRLDRSRLETRRDDAPVIETINIHNTTVGKDKDTQFIVTMDGFNPNAFLAKKLKTEGLLDEDDIKDKPVLEKVLRPTKTVLKIPEIDKSEDAKETSEKRQRKTSESQKTDSDKTSETQKTPENEKNKEPDTPETEEITPKKRLSDASDESDTQVIIKPTDKIEKRKSELPIIEELKTPPVKRRKASPIVFDVGKKEKNVEKEKEIEKVEERTRQRTESASSDSVTIATALNTNKYDALPTLSQAERKLVWCRSFPSCRYGASCLFQHPRCKFQFACTRRGCVYEHSRPATAATAATTAAAPPQIASHVVPAANYKSISGSIPNICKFYPNCTNVSCHFYHPKPCRYGKACINKLECNFYHIDAPNKWRYPV